MEWPALEVKKKFQKTLILAFEVIVQPHKRHFMTFSKVQKHKYGKKSETKIMEKQLVPDQDPDQWFCFSPIAAKRGQMLYLPWK